jgi:subtilase family serine protease
MLCAVAGALCALSILRTAAASPARDPRGQDPVRRPDLKVEIGTSKMIWPRRDITVTVSVKNVGDGPAPRSDCRILIKHAHAPRQTIKTIKKSVRALDAGDGYAFSFSVNLALGLWEIKATADRKNKILEADETNNEARIVIAGE